MVLFMGVEWTSRVGGGMFCTCSGRGLYFYIYRERDFDLRAHGVKNKLRRATFTRYMGGGSVVCCTHDDEPRSLLISVSMQCCCVGRSDKSGGFSPARTQPAVITSW